MRVPVLHVHRCLPHDHSRPSTSAIRRATVPSGIPVTEHFLQAICKSNLFSTCSTSRDAPFSVADHADRHFEDPFRLLPAHRFTHAQMMPSPTTQGVPHLLSEGLLMIISTLARRPIHDYTDVAHQPSLRTHFDIRYRQLQRHGFTSTQTALSKAPQPEPSTPTNVAQQCSSSSSDDVRRYDDETHAPWSVTYFVTPRRPQPAHGLTHDPPNSSGTPWGASDMRRANSVRMGGWPERRRPPRTSHGLAHVYPPGSRSTELSHSLSFLLTSVDVFPVCLQSRISQ